MDWDDHEALVELKQRLLIFEAKRWLGFVERGGDNKGQAVEAFQRAVDGKAVGEAWCMSFSQYCVKQVDLLVDELLEEQLKTKSLIHKSEHCLSTWNKSPAHCRIAVPTVGSLMIWQKESTSFGHTGIVVNIDTRGMIWTIEGNTGPGEGVRRDGDGVYLKKRSQDGMGKMRVLGWLLPWGPSCQNISSNQKLTGSKLH